MDSLNKISSDSLSEIEIQKIDTIVDYMIKDLEEKTDYHFNESIKEYRLPNGQLIKHNYKVCLILAEDYENKYVSYLYDRYKEKLLSLKERLLKKIKERRLLLKYLEYKNLLNIKVQDSEAPDFIYIDKGMKVGVEVAQAISEQEAIVHTIVKNPNNIKNFQKFSKGKVKKLGPNGYMPFQSSDISELVNIIPKIVKEKLDKIKTYKKCDKYSILIEVYNPLISLKDYEDFLNKECNPNHDEIKVVLISDNFEGQEILEIKSGGEV